MVGGLFDPGGHQGQGVDVQAGVDLVEYRIAGSQHPELEDLVAFLLPSGQVDVERPVQEPWFDADPLRLGGQHGRHGVDAAPRSAGRFGGHRGQAHSRHLGGLLEGEEQAGLGPLPGLQAEQVDPVEGDLPAGHLVARSAHQHVGQGRFAGTVGSHHGVDLAGADLQVDAVEDLDGPHPGAEPLDAQHPLGAHWSTTTWSPSKRTS